MGGDNRVRIIGQQASRPEGGAEIGALGLQLGGQASVQDHWPFDKLWEHWSEPRLKRCGLSLSKPRLRPFDRLRAQLARLRAQLA
jgi:hypothetical protein